MDRRLRAAAIAVATLVAILAIATLFGRAPARKEKVMIGSVGETGMEATLHRYCKEKGLYAKHGLNVTHVPFYDPYTLVLALFTGKLDACFTSAGLAGHSLAEGEECKIGMVLAISEQALLVRPGITEPADLKDRRIGVIGKTSDSYHLMKWYLEAQGLDVESEADVVEVKNPASLTANYLNGQIDAIVIWGSFAQEVTDFGGHIMATQSECLENLIGHPYYTPLALISKKMMELHPEASKGLMRALREGIKEVQSHKEEAIEFLAGVSNQPVESVSVVLRERLLGDMDDAIQQDLIAYFDYATERGFFESPVPSDVFYDDWR